MNVIMFPSPCGVWVVSVDYGDHLWHGGEFPSPCGLWVVSGFMYREVDDVMFPSPCGVWVVSPRAGLQPGPPRFRPLAGCGLFRRSASPHFEAAGFRPLAGCGLFPRAACGRQARKWVSVPLRGVGCFGKAAHSFWCNRKKNCQLCCFIVSYWQMFINNKLRNCKVPCEAHKTAT